MSSCALAATPVYNRNGVANIITYSNAMKELLLEVPPFVLKHAGAVSKDCALAMAVGLARKFDADYSVAVTGIAGPDGGSDAKPVGTVHIATARTNHGLMHRQEFFQYETRSEIQLAAVQVALQALRDRMT